MVDSQSEKQEESSSVPALRGVAQGSAFVPILFLMLRVWLKVSGTGEASEFCKHVSYKVVLLCKHNMYVYKPIELIEQRSYCYGAATTRREEILALVLVTRVKSSKCGYKQVVIVQNISLILYNSLSDWTLSCGFDAIRNQRVSLWFWLATR